MESFRLMLDLFNPQAGLIVALVRELDQKLRKDTQILSHQQLTYVVHDVGYNKSYHGVQACLDISLCNQVYIETPLLTGMDFNQISAFKPIRRASVIVRTNEVGVSLYAQGETDIEKIADSIGDHWRKHPEGNPPLK